MKSAAVIGVLFALGLLAVRPAAADEQPGVQRPAQFEFPGKAPLDYLFYLPQNYAERDQWPLVLFLHGSGERGSDLELVKKHGPPKLIAAGKQFPFIVVSPQCPGDLRWQPAQLAGLLDDVASRYKVDPDRIYVTGLSMGGQGTWNLAGFAPDRFAAIVPVCGSGEPESASSFAHVPVWVFHGAQDAAVPLDASRRMVEALTSAGGTPKFTIYPEAGHDSWTETYENPELYDWLLAQKRQPVKSR